MGKRHILWIDALKGLGIFLVTLGHLSPGMPLETHIYSFHMCLFFFISGYLFKCRESLPGYIGKKVKSILIPFLVWDFLATMLALVSKRDVVSALRSFFVVDGELCWDTPIWFLLVLFFVECLFAIFKKINHSKMTSLIILAASLLIWIIWYLAGAAVLTFELNLIPFAMFFYALGDLSRGVISKVKLNMQTGITMAVMLAISIVFGAVLNIRVTYTAGSFGNLFYFILASIAGTLFYVLLFKNLKFLGKIKILRTVGKNSLIILCLHFWLFRIYDAAASKILHIELFEGENTIKAFLLAILTVAIIVLIAELIKKLLRDRPVAMKVLGYLGIR